jgi:uncharacterized protein YbbK (DUF523 family)/uncharacterized protein YbgA (DUF1722 family)
MGDGSLPGRDEIRVGISACLLGQPVRYDGGHKRDPFLTETLARFVTFVPVCPEVEIGLGTPRETLRLVRARGGMRLLEPRTGRDHTAKMRAYASSRVRELAELDLSGYVLKRNSPSCGMESVRSFDPAGAPAPSGRGLFAEELLARAPLLPVEEEGRLRDPRRRDSFLERVFAYRRVRDLFAPRWRNEDVARFHEAARLQLLAHDPRAHDALGRLVARAGQLGRGAVARRYLEGYLGALALPAPRRRHAKVLRGAADRVGNSLEPAERAALDGAIERFERGLAPLAAPLALLRRHARTARSPALWGQHALEPYPAGLMEADPLAEA